MLRRPSGRSDLNIIRRARRFCQLDNQTITTDVALITQTHQTLNSWPDL